MPAIPPNSLVVVTGITGYVASHIGLTALQAGHRVRGTVRSLARGEEVKAAYAKLGADVDKLEFVVVDDLTSQAQMENAIKGADGFIHVALPGSVPGDSDERPQEAIDSALAVLRAAAGEPSVKRVVFTSSSVAVIAPPDFKDKTLTDQDWNDEGAESYAATKEEDKNGFGWVNLRYAAMKTLSEKAAWKWVSEEKPAFDVVSILPNVNFGPVLFGGPRTTVSWIYSLLHNDGTWASMIPPQWFVDVRDDARLHLLALTTPSASGKRIWGVAEPFGWNRILGILRKEFPHVQVPSDIAGAQGEPDRQKIDNSVASDLLGGWISLEKSVVDTAIGFGFSKPTSNK